MLRRHARQFVRSQQPLALRPSEMRSTLTFGDRHQSRLLVARNTTLLLLMTVLSTLGWRSYAARTKPFRPTRRLQPGRRLSMAYKSNALGLTAVENTPAATSPISSNLKELRDSLSPITLRNSLELQIC